MEVIEAVYRATTPMFVGGAEPEKAAELRLPSFKGVLRFWWRAGVWPSIAASGGRVRDLRQREADLFGSSDEGIGQSKISMRLHLGSPARQPIPKGTQLKDGDTVVGHGARYLGYGVMEAFARRNKGTREGELTRECLPAPFTFHVSMRPHHRLSEEQRRQLLLALKLLGLLGSLGSKARKGYGSLTLTRLAVGDKDVWSPPAKAEELGTVLGSLLREILGDAVIGPAAVNHPPFTAFSPQTRILIVPPRDGKTTPLAVLDHVGRAMIRYRSYGHNGKILGSVDRENPFAFQEDHDLMKKPRQARSGHPQRIAFGLPQNYGKDQVKPENFDRRASPLFLHIHQASDAAPAIGVLCFMPAEFLPPDRSDISVGGKQVPLNNRDLWKPIREFLDRFSSGKAKEPFGAVLEVPHA